MLISPHLAQLMRPPQRLIQIPISQYLRLSSVPCILYTIRTCLPKSFVYRFNIEKLKTFNQVDTPLDDNVSNAGIAQQLQDSKGRIEKDIFCNKKVDSNSRIVIKNDSGVCLEGL